MASIPSENPKIMFGMEWFIMFTIMLRMRLKALFRIMVKTMFGMELPVVAEAASSPIALDSIAVRPRTLILHRSI